MPQDVSISQDITPQNRFLQVHAPVEHWEGGYVDHPSDPGGATNMGITLATLSRWRKRTVSRQEVKDLSREEARAIFRKWYYDAVGGDRLPGPVALAVYNSAVLSGVGRAVKWLQSTLNSMDQRIEVDGEAGAKTLAAAARVDAQQLAAAYFDRYEQFLRALAHWPTFGKGWLNRLNDMRAAALNLPVENLESSETPEFPVPHSSSDDHTLAEALALILADLVQSRAAPADPLVHRRKPLTQVNGALGETLGKALDGRKTAFGAIGLVATAILPVILPDFAAILGMAGGGGTVWMSIFSALTGWGLLGKTEKLVKTIRG